MAIIKPVLSTNLRSALESAETLHDFVMNAFPNTFKSENDRVTLLAAKTHLADDLYGSILYLLAAGNAYDGGAFALLRPLVEVSVEGQWQFFCASDNKFRQAYAGEDVDPGLGKMMDALDTHANDTICQGLRSNVDTLHGLTHGGIEQLVRRFDPAGGLRATYSDYDKIQVIKVATAIYVLISTTFCTAASGQPEDSQQSIAIKTRNADFIALMDRIGSVKI